MKTAWKKAKSVKPAFPKPRSTEQYTENIGPQRPSAMERLSGDPIVNKLSGYIGKARDWAASHPINHPDDPERRRRRPQRRESEGYDNGFDMSAFIPQGFGAPQRQTRARPQEGGVFSMSDFVPAGFMGMPNEPAPNPRRRRRRTDRRY